jgi:hypothetical protein
MWKLPAFFFFAAVPYLLLAQNPLPPVQAEMEEDLATIGSFHPRLEGSAGEKETISFIASRLSAYRIPFSSFNFSQTDFQHSFSSCIRVDVRGAIRDTVIVAVPLDNPPNVEKSSGGAVNIAMALGLLRRLKDMPPPVSVTVLFLGAEFGSTSNYPMGSNLFLDDFQPDFKVAVLYLNLRAVPSRLVVRGGGTGIVSPYWLMERCVNALTQAGIPFNLRGYENQVFRLGLSGEHTVIEPFLRAGYPAISLETDSSSPTPARAGGWLFSANFFFEDFLHACSDGIPQEWDRHYLLFQEAGASLIVAEKEYVILLLAVLTGALLSALIFSKGLRKYVRTLRRNFFRIIPIFAIPFLLLLAATYTLERIMELKGFPTLWTYSPYLFFLLKLSLPLFLFTALYGLIRRLPFPRNGSFYSASSLFFLLVDILVVAVINVSFSFYFLWAFFFVLLAAMARNRWGKLILFLPSAYWGVRGLVDVFLMPALSFCRFFLLSPINGNLLIAAAILPFILFAIRLGLLFRGGGLLRRGVRLILFPSVFLATSLALSLEILLVSPFGPDRPQPVTITQTINEDEGTNQVALESPAPIGSVRIFEAKNVTDLEVDERGRLLPLPPVKVPIEVTVRESEFLEKKNLSLQVSSDAYPRSVNAVLTSADEFILLDCSFPFIRKSAHEYQLLIGAFPPDPLPIQLTLPAGMSFTLTLTMEVDAPLLGVDILPEGAKADTHLHFVKSVQLRT